MRGIPVNAVIGYFILTKDLNICKNAYNNYILSEIICISEITSTYICFKVPMVFLSLTKTLAGLHLQPNLCIPQLMPIKKIYSPIL